MTGSTVGRVVVEAIAHQGVTHAFCVPGESYLGILDAFNDAPGLSVVAARHEEGAGFMAHAAALATGRPGIVLVTRGPGVTHLSVALHAARQDSIPLVAIVGQVPTKHLGREAFQELDLINYGATLCKASMEMREASRAGETIARALYLAQVGRPGPVLVSVPEDVANAAAEPAEQHEIAMPRSAPNPSDIRRAAHLLLGSSSVAIIAGGGVLRAHATGPLVKLAELLDATVYTGFRRLDAFPNDHRCYAGSLPWLSDELQAPLREADTVLALGTRMSQFTSLNYDIPGPYQHLIHVDTDPSSMSLVRSELEITADVGAAIDALTTLIRPGHDDFAGARATVVSKAHAAYLASTSALIKRAPNALVDLEAVFGILREGLPADAAITCDAGAFSGYLHRYFQWLQPGTFFGTSSGSMGYAVPAAIGAKLSARERPIVAVAGDGGFAMTMSEVYTAVRLGLRELVFLVLDNGSYGTIRLHQQRHYPGREIAVDQGRADVEQIARGMGATAFRVETTEGLAGALELAMQAPGPSVIHALTDPEQLTAWAT